MGGSPLSSFPQEQGTLETLRPSLTLLGDSEGDQPCSFHKGAMRLKSKLPGHVAGVEARVIQSDVKHSDGHVLQVFAPIPLQTSLEGTLHLLLAIPILVDLQVEKQKRVGSGEKIGSESWDGDRARQGQGRKGTWLQGDPKNRSGMRLREGQGREKGRER